VDLREHDLQTNAKPSLGRALWPLCLEDGVIRNDAVLQVGTKDFAFGDAPPQEVPLISRNYPDMTEKQILSKTFVLYKDLALSFQDSIIGAIVLRS
jgi:hypothetical protein